MRINWLFVGVWFGILIVDALIIYGVYRLLSYFL